MRPPNMVAKAVVMSHLVAPWQLFRRRASRNVSTRLLNVALALVNLSMATLCLANPMKRPSEAALDPKRDKRGDV